MRPADTRSPSAVRIARFVQSAGGDQLVDERCAAAAQDVVHRLRVAADGGALRGCGAVRHACVSRLAVGGERCPGPRVLAEEQARPASRRPPASPRGSTARAAPSPLRRSGTACRASTARSRPRAPAARCAPRRRRRARSRRAPRRPPAGRRSPSAGSTGATCCHANRNRMKSAGLTGSISARSRLSV